MRAALILLLTILSISSGCFWRQPPLPQPWYSSDADTINYNPSPADTAWPPPGWTPAQPTGQPPKAIQ
jgi:hypothetical protein